MTTGNLTWCMQNTAEVVGRDANYNYFHYPSIHPSIMCNCWSFVGSQGVGADPSWLWVSSRVKPAHFITFMIIHLVFFFFGGGSINEIMWKMSRAKCDIINLPVWFDWNDLKFNSDTTQRIEVNPYNRIYKLSNIWSTVYFSINR